MPGVIGNHKTTVQLKIKNGIHQEIEVIYHSTPVYTWNKRGYIILNTGGSETLTTKRRINQSFQEFGYNARVFSKNFSLFCQFQDKLYKFKGNILKIPLN